MLWNSTIVSFVNKCLAGSQTLFWNNHNLGEEKFFFLQPPSTFSFTVQFFVYFNRIFFHFGKCLLCFKQGFVLAVTVLREAVDEFRRYKRDKEMNSQLYSKLTVRGWLSFSPL